MTELKRHPHADVLIAIAEGREVQYRYRSELAWVNYDIECDATPLSAHEREWRVKPQKLKMWVNVYKTIFGYSTKDEANERAAPDRIACIEIEFEEGEGL